MIAKYILILMKTTGSNKFFRISMLLYIYSQKIKVYTFVSIKYLKSALYKCYQIALT